MATKEYTDSILDDLEKAKLTQFVEDDVMREAVKKVLLAGLYQNGTVTKGKKVFPTINGAFGMVSNQENMTNEQVGANLRALWEGLRSLELAFSNMANYKREKLPPPKGPNSAR